MLKRKPNLRASVFVGSWLYYLASRNSLPAGINFFFFMERWLFIMNILTLFLLTTVYHIAIQTTSLFLTLNSTLSARAIKYRLRSLCLNLIIFGYFCWLWAGVVLVFFVLFFHLSSDLSQDGSCLFLKKWSLRGVPLAPLSAPFHMGLSAFCAPRIVCLLGFL